jgi:hypothetical protein
MRSALAFGFALLLACSTETKGGSGSSKGGASGGGAAGATSGTAGASGGSMGGSSGGSMTSGAGGATSGAGGAGGTTSAGGAGGSGGASGAAGTSGGTAGAGGGGSAVDAGLDRGPSGSGGQSAGTDSGSGDGDPRFPPITECTKPSVDRLEVWTSSGPAEGTTIPPTGNLVVMEGDHYVAKVEFLNVEWHVCPVYLGNQFSANANLAASSGFLLTYSSTSDMYVQARPTSHWSGGTQWATKIPSTGGVKKAQFFSFDPANWKSLFGTPTWTMADTLKEVLGFVFVGQTPNVITFYGLRVGGYVPPCR